jgi:enoyl-CoA hydratase/carnithine racemase
MRNALMEAFHLVRADDSISRVTLRGAGSSYSSGGDLDEFGSFADPASAHLVRLTASVGRAIAEVSARVRVELRGACMGSGIELPAFAARGSAFPSSGSG